MGCHIYFLTSIIFITQVFATDYFRAAVVEHAVILPGDRNGQTSRGDAKRAMAKNLEIYASYARHASAQRADIIVFPEDGIYGPQFTWHSVTPYLEFIPNPKTDTTWIPCTEPNRYPDSYVQNFLSCVAKNNSMYVVANMGDKQPCNRSTDKDCPVDGHYQYNTDVAFDPHGRLLAKYHKQNLYFEFQFNTPKQSNPTYFDTPFGRFGMFTCFDILFRSPAIDLIHDMGIRNIAFPTAWMDALPYFAAVQFHSAYAAGLGLNLLAANLHWPVHRFQGSGIYSPSGAVQFYYNNSIASDGKLLVQDLKVLPTRARPTVAHTVPQIPLGYGSVMTPPLAVSFHSLLHHDVFNFRLITDTSGTTEVCQNGLCCNLEYNTTSRSDDELYAFGAFRGLHTYHGKYFIEVCILLKCESKNLSSCGSKSFSANSVFDTLTIAGNFSTSYIFPEILLSDGNSQLTLSTRNWTYGSGALQGNSGFSDGKPLVTAALFGRNYEMDF